MYYSWEVVAGESGGQGHTHLHLHSKLEASLSDMGLCVKKKKKKMGMGNQCLDATAWSSAGCERIPETPVLRM